MPNLIVFTDLDGTLLDHSNYSYVSAKPALIALKELQIPLILASSKTSVEINSLREEIGFSDCPAIVENGAGLLAPGQTSFETQDASDYTRLTQIIANAPEKLRQFYKGFNDWSIEELVEITGLPRGSAVNAAKRQFSEPGLWTGTDEMKEAFSEYLSQNGVSYRHGGRFMTLSFGATKGQRIEEICLRYTKPDKQIISLSLGDAPNDVEMLQATDYGVIISNEHSVGIPELPEESNGKIIRTTKTGPAGWNDAVLDFISKHSGSNPQIKNTPKTESEKDIG